MAAPDPVTETPAPPAKQRARRQKVNVSIHPDTIARLDDLCGRFTVTRGVVLDRVVHSLWVETKTGVSHCAHGAKCAWNKGDVPDVF